MGRRLTIRHFEKHDQDSEIAVRSTANLIAAVVLFIGLDLILRLDLSIRPGDVVEGLEWHSKEKEPSVFLAEFTRFRVVYNVLVWIDDVETAYHRQSDLNEALWKGLEKAGIELVET